jgi:hypothetical protein
MYNKTYYDSYHVDAETLGRLGHVIDFYDVSSDQK